MKILHYSLGFPPYRTGGLTKFSYDLMREQVKEGHKVALLWPGKISLINHKTKIIKNPSVNKIENYEIINPIPVPYDEGIINISTFTDCGDKIMYFTFLNAIRPNVIHVHTLMGLHKNFLVAAKELGIRLVFTTHDFFPICPKVTLFRSGEVCTTIDECSFCPQCNLTALSLRKMQILQSPFYRDLKENKLVKKIRKSQRDKYLSENIEVNGDPFTTVDDYRFLRLHYNSMLHLIDFVHYNSTLTKCVYDKYLGEFNGEVIPITHADIKDNRVKKLFTKYLRITYLSAQSNAKGYFVLKKALDILWKENKNFTLNIFFKPISMAPYIKVHDRYKYDQLESIFNNTDVLVAPSVWYETFGFTVLEALSFGVPVVISDHVGAKDIIPVNAGKVFKAGNIEELVNTFRNLSKCNLEKMNNAILNASFDYCIKNFSILIFNKAYQ